MYKIAIFGKANSGKNTVSNLLANGLTSSINNVQFYAFANPIKNMILDMFPLADFNDLFGPSALRSKIIPGTNVSYRDVLLGLGKFGRNINPNIWIDLCQHNYESYINFNSCQVYIISDGRFVDEFEYLKKEKFTLIRLLRNDITKINDISETSQDQLPDYDFHYIIKNNGTMDELKQRCLNICEGIKLKESEEGLENIINIDNDAEITLTDDDFIDMDDIKVEY